MARKTFYFYDQSYWLSACCDCCSDDYIECYNSDDTDPILGSAHSEDDCYINAILTDHGATMVSDEYRDFLYNASLDELKSICKGLDIEVVIEGLEEGDEYY